MRLISVFAAALLAGPGFAQDQALTQAQLQQLKQDAQLLQAMSDSDFLAPAARKAEDPSAPSAPDQGSGDSGNPDSRLSRPRTLSLIYDTLAAAEYSQAADSGLLQGQDLEEAGAKVKSFSSNPSLLMDLKTKKASGSYARISSRIRGVKASPTAAGRGAPANKKVAGLNKTLDSINAQLADPGISAAQKAGLHAQAGRVYERLAASARVSGAVAVVDASVMDDDGDSAAPDGADDGSGDHPQGKKSKIAAKPAAKISNDKLQRLADKLRTLKKGNLLVKTMAKPSALKARKAGKVVSANNRISRLTALRSVYRQMAARDYRACISNDLPRGGKAKVMSSLRRLSRLGERAAWKGGRFADDVDPGQLAQACGCPAGTEPMGSDAYDLCYCADPRDVDSTQAGRQFAKPIEAKLAKAAGRVADVHESKLQSHYQRAQAYEQMARALTRPAFPATPMRNGKPDLARIPSARHLQKLAAALRSGMGPVTFLRGLPRGAVRSSRIQRGLAVKRAYQTMALLDYRASLIAGLPQDKAKLAAASFWRVRSAMVAGRVRRKAGRKAGARKAGAKFAEDEDDGGDYSGGGDDSSYSGGGGDDSSYSSGGDDSGYSGGGGDDSGYSGGDSGGGDSGAGDDSGVEDSAYAGATDFSTSDSGGDDSSVAETGGGDDSSGGADDSAVSDASGDDSSAADSSGSDSSAGGDDSSAVTDSGGDSGGDGAFVADSDSGSDSGSADQYVNTPLTDSGTQDPDGGSTWGDLYASTSGTDDSGNAADDSGSDASATDASGGDGGAAADDSGGDGAAVDASGGDAGMTADAGDGTAADVPADTLDDPGQNSCQGGGAISGLHGARKGDFIQDCKTVANWTWKCLVNSDPSCDPLVWSDGGAGAGNNTPAAPNASSDNGCPDGYAFVKGNGNGTGQCQKLGTGDTVTVPLNPNPTPGACPAGYRAQNDALQPNFGECVPGAPQGFRRLARVACPAKSRPLHSTNKGFAVCSAQRKAKIAGLSRKSRKGLLLHHLASLDRKANKVSGLLLAKATPAADKAGLFFQRAQLYQRMAAAIPAQGFKARKGGKVAGAQPKSKISSAPPKAQATPPFSPKKAKAAKVADDAAPDAAPDASAAPDAAPQAPAAPVVDPIKQAEQEMSDTTKQMQQEIDRRRGQIPQ